MTLAMDIFGCTMDTFTMAYLYNKTFKKSRVDKKVLFFVFLLSWAMFLANTFFISSPELHALFSLDILIPLFFYRSKMRVKALLALIYLAVGYLAEMFIKALSLTFYGDLAALQADFVNNYIIGIIGSRILAFVIVVIIAHVIKIREDYVPFKLCLPLFLIPIASMYTLTKSKNIYYHTNTPGDYFELLINVSFEIINIILLFYLFGETTENGELKKILALKGLAQKMIKEQYERLAHAQEVIRGIYHDMDNWLIAIAGMDTIDRVRQYAGARRGEIKQFMLDVTGYGPLDAAIYDKLDMAAKQKTRFIKVINMPQDIDNIDIVDFALMVANCLDNALEATAKITEQNKRWVKIEIKPKGNKLALIVSNSVAEKVDIINIKTSKKDMTMHGIGLKHIKETTEKYNGVMDLDCNDERFIIAITLG